MTNAMPQFVSLKPIIISHNRVTLNLETTNFPSTANVRLDLTLDSDPLSSPPENHAVPGGEETVRHTPYPNVELSILDDEQNSVAQLLVVEHKEEFISMTMHIRRPNPNKTYIARADMIHDNRLIQTLTTPFDLSSLPSSKAEIE